MTLKGESYYLQCDMRMGSSPYDSLSFFCFRLFSSSISVLPASAFENLNSLETLNIQNNKLTRIPEEVMEPIIDTLRVVDIVGKYHEAWIK